MTNQETEKLRWELRKAALLGLLNSGDVNLGAMLTPEHEARELHIQLLAEAAARIGDKLLVQEPTESLDDIL